MLEPITNKRQMYKALSSGKFGNTIQQYSPAEWWESNAGCEYAKWGVRTKTVGGPCRLHCPSHEVMPTVKSFSPHECNVSVMLDCVGQVTWLGDIYRSEQGLVCSGHESPPRTHNWRDMMKHPNLWMGLRASMLLKKHLNANSYDDLMLLIELYPDHVYELSALDVCYGMVPLRNSIIWEVRAY